MKILLEYLELILTLAGLGVILGVTFWFHPDGFSAPEVAAITATAVGIIHGVLFWLVRHRQRVARRQALAEARLMLRDVVTNQLAVIQLGVGLKNDVSTPQALSHINKAVSDINETLTELSEESLRSWRSRYKQSPVPQTQR